MATPIRMKDINIPSTTLEHWAKCFDEGVLNDEHAPALGSLLYQLAHIKKGSETPQKRVYRVEHCPAEINLYTYFVEAHSAAEAEEMVREGKAGTYNDCDWGYEPHHGYEPRTQATEHY